MQEHTVKAFDEDITRLRGLIAEMGGLSEAAIAQSLEALIKGDDELADRVVKGDKKIDALESEIDKLAVRIIALRAPMADDLREVIAADRRLFEEHRQGEQGNRRESQAVRTAYPAAGNGRSCRGDGA